MSVVFIFPFARLDDLNDPVPDLAQEIHGGSEGQGDEEKKRELVLAS